MIPSNISSLNLYADAVGVFFVFCFGVCVCVGWKLFSEGRLNCLYTLFIRIWEGGGS